MFLLFCYMLNSGRIDFFRYLFWTAIVTVFLLMNNLPVLSKFKGLEFYSLLVPYFLSLWIWLFLLDLVKRNPKKIWTYLSLLLLQCVLSYHGAYFYYYEFLPQFDIVLYTRPIEGEEHVFFSRVATANGIFAFIVFIDYLFWHNIIHRIQDLAVNKHIQYLSKTNQLSVSSHLSVHFIKSLLFIVKKNKIFHHAKIFDFILYIFSNISQERCFVALEEEWANLKTLISMIRHRNIKIYGEEVLGDKDWNRSIPVVSLLTWLENAINYSSADKNYPIELRWTRHDQGVQLAISNRISNSVMNTERTGQGLKLLEAVFLETDYEVHYLKDNDQKFEVTLTIK